MADQRQAYLAAGSDSGFPTAEERRAHRAERLADLRFRQQKGYPLSPWDRWVLRMG